MLVNNLGWHNDQSKISQNFTHFIQMELSKNPKSENDISLSTVPSYSIHISNSFFLLLFLWSEVSNKKKKNSLSVFVPCMQNPITFSVVNLCVHLPPSVPPGALLAILDPLKTTVHL